MLSVSLAQPSIHTTGIQRGTGEEVTCFTELATCRGVNASGKRLIDRVVKSSQTFTRAASRLIGDWSSTRPLTGELTTDDLKPVSAALRKLPVQLSLGANADDRAILFVFLHDNPAAAVPIVANDPYGFMALLNDVREGQYGAGDLIDAPFPTTVVLGALAAVAVLGGAVLLARR